MTSDAFWRALETNELVRVRLFAHVAAAARGAVAATCWRWHDAFAPYVHGASAYRAANERGDARVATLLWAYARDRLGLTHDLAHTYDDVHDAAQHMCKHAAPLEHVRVALNGVGPYTRYRCVRAACVGGHVDVVRMLLREYFEQAPHFSSGDQRTSWLVAAALHKHVPCMHVVLAHHAAVLSMMRDADAVASAVQWHDGSPEWAGVMAAHYLLVLGARDNHESDDQELKVAGLFLRACTLGDDAIVALLLANVHTAPASEMMWGRGLVKAADNGCMGVVRRLLRRPALIDRNERSAALRGAARTGHADMVDVLLCDDGGVLDVHANDHYALRTAAYHGHVRVVERLLRDARVDPTARDHYALRWAYRNGHVRVVDVLLRDARVDARALERA